jgi:hypothetical protein
MKYSKFILVDSMRKDDRPVAEHILAVLEENKGKGLRFRDLKMAMGRHGWFHVDSSIVQNYTWLVKQGNIVKIGRYYGIPVKKEDGKSYIEPTNLDESIEVRKDAEP